MKRYGVFDLIALHFAKTGVSYVLIGGFAVNAHGVSRHTADVDILVTEEDYRKISALLQKEGYRETARKDIFARLEGGSYRLFDLDFLFVDEETLKAIRAAGKQVKIGGRTFIVPSIRHLIALKLHAMKNDPKQREFRDLPDVVELIRVNRIDVKSKWFRELCLTYGTQSHYKKITEACA